MKTYVSNNTTLTFLDECDTTFSKLTKQEPKVLEIIKKTYLLIEAEFIPFFKRKKPSDFKYSQKDNLLKWNIDSKLTECAVIETVPAFLTSTISKNIVARSFFITMAVI